MTTIQLNTANIDDDVGSKRNDTIDNDYDIALLGILSIRDNARIHERLRIGY